MVSASQINNSIIKQLLDEIAYTMQNILGLGKRNNGCVVVSKHNSFNSVFNLVHNCLKYLIILLTPTEIAN